MMSITKGAVWGGGNFRFQGHESQEKAGASQGDLSTPKELIFSE